MVNNFLFLAMNDENYPPAIDLLRSSSTNDVLAESRSSSPPPVDQLRLIKTTVINSQPQDFVVTNGQTYRVNRSPIGISLRGKRAPVVSDSTTTSESSPEKAKIKMLLKGLDDANRKIADQSNDIMTLQHNEAIYQKRINVLEIKCGEELTVFSNELVSVFKSASKAPSEDDSTKCGSDTPSRHRHKIQNAMRNEKELKVHTFAPSLSHLNPYDDDLNSDKLRSFSEDSSFITPPMSNQSTPSSVGMETVNTLRSSQDMVLPAAVSEDEIDHSPIKTDPNTHIDNMLLMGDALKQTRIPSKKSALAARLGMSAKDRRSKDVDQEKTRPSNNRNNNMKKFKSSPHLTNNTAPSGDAINQIHTPSYVWQQSDADEGSIMPCTLFIAHDNPQLGKTVADAISGGMEMMIESKALDSKIAFVLAKIVYSGPVENVLISKGTAAKSAASSTLPRGSQCLVCTELRAFAFELSKDCDTRVQGVIAEINLCKEKLPNGCSIDVSNEEKLRTFFRACDARVDVILSPHHAQTWYPYWEYGSEPNAAVASGTQPGPGARKMAPQFRSKGIGYLRLGDDMSRFGTSFLSCDGFDSFMDEGKGGVEDKLSLSASLTLETKGGLRDLLPARISRAASMPTGLVGQDEEEDKAVGADIANDQDLGETVMSLQSSALKWSDRVACLQQISDYLVKQVNVLKNTTTIPGTILDTTAKCLISQILTQKNPLVLKEATRCAGCIGSHFSVLNVFNAKGTESLAKTWAELFVLCVHNLRHANRGVSEAAKASLSSLLGSCVVDLRTLAANIRDLIAGPLRPGSTTQPVVSSAPNTARVLQWMIGILEDYSRQLFQLKTYAETVNVVTFTVPSSDEEVTGLGYTYNEMHTNSIVLISQCVLSLLNHKDVSVREAAVTLSAQLFSLDILHCGKVMKFNLNTYHAKELQQSGTIDSIALELLPFPNDFKSLVNSLSADCQNMFTSAMEKKQQVKVVQRSIEYVNKLYSYNKNQTTHSDSFSQEPTPSSSSLSTGESPPTSELKKSLSALTQKSKRPRKLRRSSSSKVVGNNEGEAPVGSGSSGSDPIADQLFEVNLSLKCAPTDEDSWKHFSMVGQ